MKVKLKYDADITKIESSKNTNLVKASAPRWVEKTIFPQYSFSSMKSI